MEDTPEQTAFLNPAQLMEAGRARVADTTPEEPPTEAPPEPPGDSVLYRRAFAATERYAASSAQSPHERAALETEAEQLRAELAETEGWDTKERLWNAVIARATRYALGEALEPLEPAPEETTATAPEKEGLTMAEFLNPSKMMREGREQMRRDAEPPAAPLPPGAQPAAPAEFREWMEPPSDRRNDINWQARAGWRPPWQRYVDWAGKHAPAALAGIEVLEDRLTQARKTAASGDSDIKVITVQRAIARAYTQLEATYEASFKTRRR